jgi:hypothetical protein
MTYKEALAHIEQNRKALDKYTLNENPPHFVLGTFISTKERDYNTEQYIYEQCKEGKSNEDVLLELNKMSNDLIPYVVLKIGGNEIAQPLDSYIAPPNISGE